MYRNTANNTNGSIKVVGSVAPTTNYNDTALSSATIYYYWLKAFGPYANSPYSTFISNSTFILPQPQWVNAVPAATNQINLTWNYISSATSYTLFRNTINNTNGSIKAGGTLTAITNFNDSTGIIAGTVYYYWLKAYNLIGNSPYSISISTSTILHPPLWVSINPAATNQINLLWHRISLATSYTLFQNTINNTNGASKVIGTIANITNYNDIGLLSGTNYYYWLRAYNAEGPSTYSPDIVSSPMPPTPRWISATPSSTNQINLLWHYMPLATSFTLFRNTSNNTNGIKSVTGTLNNVTNFNDTNLSPNTSYYYWLRAYNLYAHSAYSTAIWNSTLIPYRVNNLDSVIIAPNPFKANALNSTITFYNLTADAVIKVYTITGRLITSLSTIDYKCVWDTRDSRGKLLPLGMYTCYISNSKGEKKYLQLMIQR